MKSLKNGKNTSKLEITNISEHGFWILLSGTEYFLPFEKYPWFKNAKISAIINVKLLHGHHLYWPELDIDLTTNILSNPDKYPLTYHCCPNQPKLRDSCNGLKVSLHKSENYHIKCSQSNIIENGLAIEIT